MAFIVENIWKYGPNAMERYIVQSLIQAGDVRMQTMIETPQVTPGIPISAVAE